MTNFFVGNLPQGQDGHEVTQFLESSEKMKNKPTTEINCKLRGLSRLLDYEFRDAFIHVINKLDPRSFSRLARASVLIHDLCYNMKGIAIPFGVWLEVHAHDGTPIFTLWRGCGEKRRFWTVKRSDYEKFYACSFLAFNLQAITFICNVDERILQGTREFLKKFKHHSVKKIILRGDVSDWSDLIRFIQEKKVKQLTIGYHHRTNTEISPSIPDELLPNLLKNNLRHAIRDDFVLRSTSPSLNIRGAAISKKTFKKLIEKCSSTSSDIQWRIGRQPPCFIHCPAPEIDDFIGILDSFDSLDFHHEGPVPSCRPLLFTRVNLDNDFAFGSSRWILRRDGKLVSFSFDWNHLYFSMTPSSQYPRCLLENH